jgi:LysW-gamma-L-lysine carboxypeptidase
MTVADPAAVDLLDNMLSIPSLCGEEDEVAELLLASIRDAGFAAHRDEVGNVVGEFGNPQSSRSVLILGHMDTVAGRIAVEHRDGALYGRGAVDAKGPLATAIVAASRVSAERDINLRVTVVGAVQEEGPSAGARHLASSAAPDFLIIAEPSGWDAIVLGYKGSLRFTVTISQPSAHTAGHEPTAPERALAFWNDLAFWCETAVGLDERPPQDVAARSRLPKSASRRPSTGTFNRLTATLISFDSHSDGLHDRASLHIGLRLPPGIDVNAARRLVQGLLPDAEFAFNPGEPAVRAAKTTPLVAGFLRAIRTEGGQPRFKVKTGTSDMNVVGPVWGCPMVAYGPGDSNLDHTPHEHIKLDEYLRAIRVLTHVLEDL